MFYLNGYHNLGISTVLPELQRETRESAPEQEGGRGNEGEMKRSPAAGKNQHFLSQSAYSESSTSKPGTCLVVLTHKKQRTFVETQKGERIWVRYKEGDGNR